MTQSTNKILVTGGAGFIGANFVLEWISTKGTEVVNLDKLTYAGNVKNLRSVSGDRRHIFVCGDIGDRKLTRQILNEHRPCAILNFAAESHVDRSIRGPADFIQTNMVGTFHLLEEVRAYWLALSGLYRENFRFLHVSTDEVFGSLDSTDPAFSETTAYAPNSPYSASKAASDFLVRAYHHTYGLPTLTTHCSNNYGPYQFPEKLVPLVLTNALAGKPLPIYGDGSNVRDWLYVRDHCLALQVLLERGEPGQTYNIGGGNEKTNLEIVFTLCDILDRASPRYDGRSYRTQIKYVSDRPGHDRRYAIDAGKIHRELKWTAQETFETGIHKTVHWYLNNRDWIEDVISGSYRESMNEHYVQL